MHWEPIETAPKDGTKMLTYCSTTSFPHQRYDLMFYAGRWRPLYGGMANSPTHWMPLPDPPVRDPQAV